MIGTTRSVALPVLIVFAALNISACETAKRFAPPGFIKYEDLEKGIPVNPAIQQRITEISPDEDAKYPNLSDTPQIVPVGLPTEERADAEDWLLATRDLVQGDIAKAREQVEIEFGLDTEGNPDLIRTGDAENLPNSVFDLQSGLEKVRADAQKEANQPLPDPIDTTQAPNPEEPVKY